ncbi:hypothetical protein GCM10008955_35250 [Deinococcus malanensis]|uniref:Uncharacterized protein n=1 Tax=Deinococcus malanensis TaxID=1706855 RepID=A0ABQ2F0J7_9DEIO|nr:hypothetical protein [Deinococcus malanensis]GGK38321.1 hypothetical protein GCM10008955_35250 [Deinococcus malanensis]
MLGLPERRLSGLDHQDPRHPGLGLLEQVLPELRHRRDPRRPGLQGLGPAPAGLHLLVAALAQPGLVRAAATALAVPAAEEPAMGEEATVRVRAPEQGEQVPPPAVRTGL